MMYLDPNINKVGDVDKNYVVDNDDFDIVTENIGEYTTNPAYKKYDLNEGGVINFDDSSIVGANIGKSYLY